VNRRPIIVTRAGDSGQLLARALTDAGEEALWLPAFEFKPAPDEARVIDGLGKLSSYELAVFVSPAAVEAVATRLSQAWPTGTAIGAVGEGTRRAILGRIPGAAAATICAPTALDSDAESSGSEALWRTMQPVVGQMRRVLILRAEHGREWLAEQLVAAGIQVETLAVYTRRTAAVPAEVAQRLRAWQAAGRTPVLVVASSEAVETVIGLLDPIVGATWSRGALALASHERIAQRLRAAGFAEVRIAALDAEAIRKAALTQ